MIRLVLAGLLVLVVTACSPATVNTGMVSSASGSVAPVAPTSSQPAPTWGQRYTWSDGLAVEVSKPRSCTPGKYAYPQGVKRAAALTITIINGRNKPVDVMDFSIANDAQFASHKAESLDDWDGPCKTTKYPSGTVLPGKTFNFDAAYTVDPQPGELQIAFQPGLGIDQAVFVGQA